MKKVIIILSLLFATAALAGPYECEKECHNQANRCIESCNRYNDNVQWQQCTNSCQKQAANCRDSCTR